MPGVTNIWTQSIKNRSTAVHGHWSQFCLNIFGNDLKRWKLRADSTVVLDISGRRLSIPNRSARTLHLHQINRTARHVTASTASYADTIEKELERRSSVTIEAPRRFPSGSGSRRIFAGYSGARRNPIPSPPAAYPLRSLQHHRNSRSIHDCQLKRPAPRTVLLTCAAGLGGFGRSQGTLARQVSMPRDISSMERQYETSNRARSRLLLLCRSCLIGFSPCYTYVSLGTQSAHVLMACRSRSAASIFGGSDNLSVAVWVGFIALFGRRCNRGRHGDLLEDAVCETSRIWKAGSSSLWKPDEGPAHTSPKVMTYQLSSGHCCRLCGAPAGAEVWPASPPVLAEWYSLLQYGGHAGDSSIYAIAN